MRRLIFIKKKITDSGFGNVGFGNAGTLMTSAFFFLTGISAGIFLELFMSSSQKENVSQYLLAYLLSGNSDMSYPNPFFSSLGGNLLLLFIILLSGLSLYGFPAAFLMLIYKGFTLGFSTCLIIEVLKLKGAGLILLTIIPQNLLIVPAFLIAAAGCVDYAKVTLAGRKSGHVSLQKNRKRQISKKAYAAFFILPAVIIFLGCIIEGLLFSIVLLP